MSSFVILCRLEIGPKVASRQFCLCVDLEKFHKAHQPAFTLNTVYWTIAIMPISGSLQPQSKSVLRMDYFLICYQLDPGAFQLVHVDPLTSVGE